MPTWNIYILVCCILTTHKQCKAGNNYRLKYSDWNAAVVSKTLSFQSIFTRCVNRNHQITSWDYCSNTLITDPNSSEVCAITELAAELWTPPSPGAAGVWKLSFGCSDGRRPTGNVTRLMEDGFPFGSTRLCRTLCRFTAAHVSHIRWQKKPL